MLRHRLRAVGEWIRFIFGCVAVMIYIYCFGKTIIEPLSPIITFLLVLFFTIVACRHWSSAALSILGLALYGASWPATSEWGTWPGLIVFALAMFAWFGAFPLARALDERKRKQLVSAT